MNGQGPAKAYDVLWLVPHGKPTDRVQVICLEVLKWLKCSPSARLFPRSDLFSRQRTLQLCKISIRKVVQGTHLPTAIRGLYSVHVGRSSEALPARHPLRQSPEARRPARHAVSLLGRPPLTAPQPLEGRPGWAAEQGWLRAVPKGGAQGGLDSASGNPGLVGVGASLPGEG